MAWNPVALVPLTSAVLYVGLIVLVRLRAPRSRSAGPFVFLLALLAASSAVSTLWRLAQTDGLSDGLLRLLIANSMTVGSAFLYLVQAQYDTPWARRARRLAVVTAAFTLSAALSGAVIDVAVVGKSDPATWAIALFVAAIIAWALAFIAGFSYLVFAYRRSRDPFERNRLKYVGVATFLIAAGSLTNTVPALQVLPLDQAIFSLSACVYAFTIFRYRLYDIDVAARRSMISLVTALLIGPMFFALIWVMYPSVRSDLLSGPGLLQAALITVFLGTLASLLRVNAYRLLDQLMLGGRVARREAVAGPLLDHEPGDVSTLVSEVTTRLQRSLESGCVAMLLRTEEGELKLAAMSGPFALLHEEWTIREDNQLLAAIVAQPEVTTPLALRALEQTADVPEHDAAEFGPYRTMLAAPVVANGELVGCLFVSPKVYDDAFKLEDLDLLRLVAGQAAIALQNAQLIKQLEERAETDYLTGLPNHRKLQDALRTMVEDAIEDEIPCSVAMIDIDNFKLLNDVHGHQIGDDALRTVSTHLRASLPPDWLVGRYGGDEFLVLAPNTARDQAERRMAVAARALRRVTLLGAEQPDGSAERLPARISYGVATTPDDGVTPRGLVSAADSQLMLRRYSLRRSGRVNTEQRPTVRALLEQDPEKLRIARALLDVIDAKDPYTSEHSQQIASFALLVADESGLPDKDRYALWLGALLHDVGKIGTPAYILRKPGRLTPEEWDLMRQHPQLGEQIVRGLMDIPEVVDIVGCHHERFDGGGYPRGLAGEDIPRLARLVSVADAFSAMVHDRPYHKGKTWEDAIEELIRHSGTQFDPEMVRLFVRAIGKGSGEGAQRVA